MTDNTGIYEIPPQSGSPAPSVGLQNVWAAKAGYQADYSGDFNNLPQSEGTVAPSIILFPIAPPLGTGKVVGFVVEQSDREPVIVQCSPGENTNPPGGGSGNTPGVDDDGDGRVDEDPPGNGDEDEDGLIDE
ncbi:hypothetical protein HYU10_00880, partial [Candidatus Woesearchaeota archaeon]|nr:hypothetical protein [Candidatus Woesearchaeota archaeon]